MSEKKDKKKIKKKPTIIIAGIISSTVLIGGAIAGGIIAATETEAKNEKNGENYQKPPKPKKNKTNQSPSGYDKKDLNLIIPPDKRNIGIIILLKTPNINITKDEKVKAIKARLNQNGININIEKIKIELSKNEKMATISSIDNEFYINEVSIEFYFEEENNPILNTENPIKEFEEIKISDVINDFKIDKAGNVYAGADKGLYKLTYENGTKFTPITSITDKITSLVIDSYGNVYAGTNGGVYKYDITKNKSNKMSGIDLNISKLIVDKDDNVYARTSNFVELIYKSNKKDVFNPIPETNSSYKILTVANNKVIYRYYSFTHKNYLETSKDWKKWTQIKFLNSTGKNLKLNVLEITPNGDIYGNVDDTIYKYNKIEENFKEIGKFNNNIKSLVVDNDGNIYILSSRHNMISDTIYKYNKIEENFKEIIKEEENISNLVVDNDGNIYILIKYDNNHNGGTPMVNMHINKIHKYNYRTY